MLIENQLEHGDHGHLGQILTYLTGLRAQTIVWVAADFREEHLSAVNWLNQNTVDPFAFFAVRLRVVRIANSPYAPLFEVIERPNGWDRRVQETTREARESGALSGLGQFRLAFWTHVVNRRPDEAALSPAGADSNRSRSVRGGEVVLVQYLAQNEVGLFLRPPRRGDPSRAAQKLQAVEERLASRLGRPLGDPKGRYFFLSKIQVDSRDRANWDRMADFLADEANRYIQVLGDVMGGDT